MRVDQMMSPRDAARWWKDHGSHREISGICAGLSWRDTGKISIRAILKYTEAKKRPRKLYKGEVVLPGWYKQGRLGDS